MFTRALKFCKKFKPLLTASILTMTYGIKKIALDQTQKQYEKQFAALPDQAKKILDNQKMLKRIVQKEVCKSKQIREGQLFFTEITEDRDDDTPNKTYTVAIGRVNGQLYAVIAHCTYKQPLSQQTTQTNNMREAIIFGDKLYCPHHGCAYDIKSGSVEYGPASMNLSRFFVEQKQGRVKLYHPAVIPVSVAPKYQWRDLNDLRKVVVLGGDHHATMGIIHGFKAYQYGGELTIINSDDYDLPYRQDLLHRKILNIRKHFSNINKNLQPIDIENIMKQTIYNPLQFQNQLWYKSFGIQHLFNPEPYRIINKRYFPYVKFLQGTKIQYDGLIFATGSVPKFPHIQNVVSANTLQDHDRNFSDSMLPNVFAPYYNKREHLRLMKYLNMYDVKKMIVMGLNIESLQFIQAINKEFPNVGIKVMDFNRDNTVVEMLGPDIGDEILKEYMKRGNQFYVQFQQIPQFKNKLGKLYEPRKLGDAISQIVQQAPVPQLNSSKIQNSIQVKLDQKTSLHADCVVLFPNNHYACNQYIKNAKFSQIDFNKKNARIIVSTHGKTDTKRMYAAGSCASQDFFFIRDYLQSMNPNVAYEQGITCAFNVNALNIPFAYIPYETHKFFDKTIMYAGAVKNFNEMYIMGDVKSWDFIAFYSQNDEIRAVSASPSRQKQFQLIRECFRLQCQPRFKELVDQKWTLPLLYKLVRKLNKSGCYKDLIKTLHPEMNIPMVIWMDRQKGSYVTNAEEDQDEKNIQVDQRGYTTESF